VWRAKIRAIEKLNMAIAAKEAALEDGRNIGEAVLWAKAKLGELLSTTVEPRGIKQKGGSTQRTTLPTLPSGITKKQSHYYQQIHKNRDVVEEDYPSLEDYNSVRGSHN